MAQPPKSDGRRLTFSVSTGAWKVLSCEVTRHFQVATNGYGTLSVYNASDTAAFALALPCLVCDENT